MSVDSDLGVEICRDDDCDIEDVHPAHRVARAPRKASSGRQRTTTWDPEGLAQSVHKAIWSTDWPVAYSDIKSFVLDDYGFTTDRAIHRHIERKSKRGDVIVLELGLCFAAYINPRSRFVRDGRPKDEENLRDHLLGKYPHFRPADARRVQLPKCRDASLDFITKHALAVGDVVFGEIKGLEPVLELDIALL